MAKKFRPPNRYASPYPMHAPELARAEDLLPLRPTILPREPTHVRFELHTGVDLYPGSPTILLTLKFPSMEPIPLNVLADWVNQPPEVNVLNTPANAWLHSALVRYDVANDAYSAFATYQILEDWKETRRPFDILITLLDGEVYHPAARPVLEAINNSFHAYMVERWLNAAARKAERKVEHEVFYKVLNLHSIYIKIVYLSNGQVVAVS